MPDVKLGYILIVEDEKFMADILSKHLREVGYEIEIAENGFIAMEEVTKRVPDLVILDLMLPIVDGFDFMQNLKNNPEIPRFPILVASNLGQKEDIERALSLGASEYIVKADFSINELSSKVKSLIVVKP